MTKGEWIIEEKEIPVMNIYGKPMTMPYILENGCYECCGTCKHYREGYCIKYICGHKDVEPISDFLFYEFVCDFYRRRNSGAFRRKLKKYKKRIKEELVRREKRLYVLGHTKIKKGN